MVSGLSLLIDLIITFVEFFFLADLYSLERLKAVSTDFIIKNKSHVKENLDKLKGVISKDQSLELVMALLEI